MVTELDTKWCTNEDAEPDTEQCANEDTKLDTERCASEDIGTPRGWIVRSHLSWRGKRSIPYKGVEISP